MKKKPEAPAEVRCVHPAKKRCQLCGESYCPNEGCDFYHIENCREALRS